MPDEHESAVAAWLADPGVQREIAVTRKNFPDWTEQQQIQFTLCVLTYVALDTYEITELPPPDDPDEPWRPRAA